MCGSDDAEILMELEAAEIVRTNWTYRPDFREILGLPPRALFPLVRCVGCKFTYARLLPNPEFLAEVYDVVIQRGNCIAGSENPGSYASRLRYAAELIELVPLGEPIRALDFGSGLGVTLRILRACGIEAIGYDPSALRAGYSATREHDTLQDVDELRSRGPFSVLVLDNVLEHLPEPRNVMEFIRQITTPRAVAYVSVPAYERAFLRHQIERHQRGESLDMTLNPWEHLNYFSLHHLDVLMRVGGFRRVSSADATGSPSIGLRPERHRFTRFKNAAASALRLARYAAFGDTGTITERTFYRRMD